MVQLFLHIINSTVFYLNIHLTEDEYLRTIVDIYIYIYIYKYVCTGVANCLCAHESFILIYNMLVTSQSIADDVTMTKQLWHDHGNSDI